MLREDGAKLGEGEAADRAAGLLSLGACLCV